MLAEEDDKRSCPLSGIVIRIQGHFVGRVITLATATIFCAISSIALLPLATRYLSASDYGTYGLLMSIVALVGAAADGGASLLVPTHYGPASALERARLFASLAALAGMAASVAALSLIVLWTQHHGNVSGISVPLGAIILSAILMPMKVITNISVMIFSATGRGPAIAAQMGAQSLVAFISTLVALFELGMGGTSLFIGAACGQFAALCVGLLALGRHHIFSFPSRHWLRRAASSVPTTAASALVDGARGFSENALLASATGLHGLGNLLHARLYHGLAMALSNAVSHNLWATSLQEARNSNSTFEITRSAWSPVQIIITGIGIIFAFFGGEIVDTISNGKFNAAAVYIPALFVIALVQTAEQPASAIVCVSGRAASATWARTVMTLGSIIVLCPMIVLFGVGAVLALCLIETVAYRVYLRILASRGRTVPFHDHIVVFGSSAIIAGTAYVHWAVPPLLIQFLFMSVGITLLIFIGRHSIIEMLSAANQIVLGLPTTKLSGRA
jgi:O-antigen/teichoic acid export membrane protein